jgi:hypothetical protein
VSACFVAGIFGVSVNGDAVVVDSNGQLGVAPAGSPLSANELLEERRAVRELKALTEKQQASISFHHGEISALTADVREQAAQIQKVSAQLQANSSTGQVVVNKR